MAYEVHLKEFDGPLDLLLHLIEQAKVDIKDIFISEITNQYLSLMEELDELDMDTASEFLTMNATPSIRLTVIPAKDTISSSFLGDLKLRVLTGTGLAQPKPNISSDRNPSGSI